MRSVRALLDRLHRGIGDLVAGLRGAADEEPSTRGEDEMLLALLRLQPHSTPEELAEQLAGSEAGDDVAGRSDPTSASWVTRQLQALAARGRVTEHAGRYRVVDG